MISESEKRTIREISAKYDVKRVLLFGSSLAPDKEGHNIDLAVEGIAPKDFFEFYGDLLLKLSKPVDVVDLSGTSKFIKMIEREGIPLYSIFN